VQESVKRAVESMTGLEVVEVNIHVQGVSFRQEGRAEERKAE
ncbi:MAG: Asp23/Gls24 family envelope stress response protein, partial [Acetobacteraceae bacterium]|nr:Asp23/Gls24 family envelope stress response protein [Acetobacteraceae bacterium]